MKQKPKVGDRVTVKKPVEAYYSNYGSFRGVHVFFQPGTTGIVGAVDVPCVRGPKPVFHCVDFDAAVMYNEKSEHPYRWRCAVYPENLVILTEKGSNAPENCSV